VVRSTEVASAGFKYLPGGPECGTPQLAVVAGSRLTHRNLDFAAHDVRSAALHPGTDDPLFASELTRYLSAGDVHGVAQLPPGRYDFYCTIHPPRTSGSGMRGTLIVQAADR
jgi:plastocyanin